MYTNKKLTTPPTPTTIQSKAGLYYHPTLAPEGLCRCRVMLELKPREEKYIFPSVHRANHARNHTITYLTGMNISVDYDNFIVVKE